MYSSLVSEGQSANRQATREKLSLAGTARVTLEVELGHSYCWSGRRSRWWMVVA